MDFVTTLQTHPCNENRVFPVYFFPVWEKYTGKSLFWPCHAFPSSIYSCSIDYFLEHEICHLGCLGRNKKILKRPNFCLSMQLFWVVFSTFWLSIEQLYIELGYSMKKGPNQIMKVSSSTEKSSPIFLNFQIALFHYMSVDQEFTHRSFSCDVSNDSNLFSLQFHRYWFVNIRCYLLVLWQFWVINVGGNHRKSFIL